MSNEEEIEALEAKREIGSIISSVDELNNISDFLHDDQIDEALAIVIRILANPRIPPQQAVDSIIFLSALCVKCRLVAKNYMLLQKTADGASQKKNLYFTIADALQELVNSLKYVTKL